MLSILSFGFEYLLNSKLLFSELLFFIKFIFLELVLFSISLFNKLFVFKLLLLIFNFIPFEFEFDGINFFELLLEFFLFNNKFLRFSYSLNNSLYFNFNLE